VSLSGSWSWSGAGAGTWPCHLHASPPALQRPLPPAAAGTHLVRNPAGAAYPGMHHGACPGISSCRLTATGWEICPGAPPLPLPLAAARHGEGSCQQRRACGHLTVTVTVTGPDAPPLPLAAAHLHHGEESRQLHHGRGYVTGTGWSG
jgi:hypothetical protein